MKKMLVLGMAALMMLAVMGCDDLKDVLDSTPDSHSPKGTWNDVFDDFFVQAGDSLGDIQYKFSGKIATSSDTVTYTLYYTEGKVSSRNTIIAKSSTQGTDSEVSPSNDWTTLSLTAGMTYSLVVKAQIDIATVAYSDVRQITASVGPQQLQLTVNNMPSGVTTAKLYTDNSTSAKPVAIAVNTSWLTSGSNIFSFMKGSTIASATTTFKETGEYYIVLENATGTTTYTYRDGSGSMAKYNFTQAKMDIDGSLFQQ